MELNPAYIEQRIQDALKTGEADEFEFGYHRLEFKQIIGKGAFGKVFLAEAYGIGGNEPISLVAVKVLNGELLKVLNRRDILSLKRLLANETGKCVPFILFFVEGWVRPNKGMIN